MADPFTSWPWGIEQTAGMLWVGPLRPDGCKVEQVVVGLDYDTCLTTASKTRRLADATLIAAAPELLEALQSLAGNAGALRAFEWEIREAAGNTNWQCLMDAIAKADAAIAKALGQ